MCNVYQIHFLSVVRCDRWNASRSSDFISIDFLFLNKKQCFSSSFSFYLVSEPLTSLSVAVLLSFQLTSAKQQPKNCSILTKNTSDRISMPKQSYIMTFKCLKYIRPRCKPNYLHRQMWRAYMRMWVRICRVYITHCLFGHWKFIVSFNCIYMRVFMCVTKAVVFDFSNRSFEATEPCRTTNTYALLEITGLRSQYIMKFRCLLSSVDYGEANRIRFIAAIIKSDKTCYGCNESFSNWFFQLTLEKKNRFQYNQLPSLSIHEFLIVFSNDRLHS